MCKVDIVKDRLAKVRIVRSRIVEDMAHRELSNNMLTLREVALLLNIHINTVRRWSNMGILKSYRIGPRADRRFRRDEVVSFLFQGAKVHHPAQQ